MKRWIYSGVLSALGIATALQGASTPQQNTMSNAKPETLEHARSYDMYGFSLSGEALYWKTVMNSQPFTTVFDSSNAVFPFVAEEKTADFKWDWGFRLGAGYQFAQRQWGLNLIFTYLRSKAVDYASSVVNNGVSIPSTVAYANNAKSTFKNKITTLDGEIKREYHVSNKVLLMPSIGVKGAWFSEDETLVFTGGDVADGTTLTQLIDYTFKGAGPRFAMNSTWMIGYGFSFISKLGASLIFGTSKNSYHYTDTLGEDFKFTVNNSIHRAVPALEGMIGVQYLYHFQDVAQSLGIHVGFDGQYYFGEYVDNKTVNDPFFSDLAFYGANLGASWYF